MADHEAREILDFGEISSWFQSGYESQDGKLEPR
jgi:hypothetical protein